MKEIKLLNLTISNWRGQNHNIDFKDTTSISAKNGAGKSTLLHAWLWVLTGYTEVGLPKNTNLFDNREVLSENTHWASVVATMEIDGYKYVVERKSKPKFTRSKGSLEFTKGSSDLYEYYIDNIEVGASGMTKFVEGTIGVPNDMLIYCLSGEFFSYLASEDKNRARAILSSLVGEVKAEDFKGDYSSIEELMERYSASDIVEMSKKKKKPLEDRQNIIPLEIDRKEARLSELKAMDFIATENEIARVKAEIDTIDGLLLGNADAVKPIIEHNREIENKVANKRLSLVNGRLAYKEEQNARTSEIKAKIAEIRRYNDGVDKDNAKIKDNAEAITKEIALKKTDLALHEKMRSDLLKERDEIKARVFTGETCAYCGQELPYDKLEEEREKFNLKKKSDLESVVARGKRSAEAIANIKERIKNLEDIESRGVVLVERKPTKEYEEALAKIEASFVPYEETDEFKQINAEIDALSKEMKEIPSNDNEVLTSQKKSLINELSELSKKLGLKDEIGKVEKDIAELRSEMRSVANAIAELEGMIFKCAEWIQERNQIVSHRINDKLSKSKIEMWSKQKNGDIVPDLVLCNNKGVKFNSTNFANRIEIQLDLQLMFQRLFEITLPIFIDESAVFAPSNLPVFDDRQTIYLFASDECTLCVK